MQITIQLVGLEKLTAKLAGAASLNTLMAPMKRAQELIRQRLADYPPPPPASTYVRTGDLGRSWGAQSPVGGVGGLMGVIASTDVSYAGFVEHDPTLGDPHQAWNMHHWQTDLQVVNESAEAIGRDFTAAIQAELNR